jgi:lipopolysaccharide transport system ATP-binding protein
MVDFRRSGKTIVLCSHSMYQVGTFCDEVLWMRAGRVRMRGAPEEVLPAYEAYQMAKDRAADLAAPGRESAGAARAARFAISTPLPMQTGDDLRVEWAVAAPPTCAYHVTISLKMDSGRGIFVTGSQLRGDPPMVGATEGCLIFAEAALMGGEYILHLRVWDDTGLVLWDESVLDKVVVRKQGREMGVVRLPHAWRIAPLAAGARDA